MLSVHVKASKTESVNVGMKSVICSEVVRVSKTFTLTDPPVILIVILSEHVRVSNTEAVSSKMLKLS